MTDATLGLVGLLGGSRMRDRYRSTSNTALAAALVRRAADPHARHMVFDSEGLHDRPCPRDQ
ncbi:MAG: hypothetical protein H0T76_16700 [Nannocystis sp.]|nr:hypothetical protein [Nannocystis sp.]MBA3548123.1 hypothetical protein [Nannocystis sp.]